MSTASKFLLFLAPLALACGKRGEEPCQAPAPASFDFVIFDQQGRNLAENMPRVFALLRSDTPFGIDIAAQPGQRTTFLSSKRLPEISLTGVKTFYFSYGYFGDEIRDTLFVDLVAGEGCAPPRYQAVRLNGKTGTFEYGIGPNGAFVFRK